MYRYNHKARKASDWKNSPSMLKKLQIGIYDGGVEYSLEDKIHDALLDDPPDLTDIEEYVNDVTVLVSIPSGDKYYTWFKVDTIYGDYFVQIDTFDKVSKQGEVHQSPSRKARYIKATIEDMRQDIEDKWYDLSGDMDKYDRAVEKKLGDSASSKLETLNEKIRSLMISYIYYLEGE